MKVSPIAGPATVKENTTQNTTSAQAAKERAIAKFMGSQAQAANGAPPAPAEVMVATAAADAAEAVAPQGQTDSSEAPVQAQAPKEVKATEKVEEPLSSQYAVLARKEKAYRAKVQAQEAALKAKEAALAEREAKLTAKDSSYETDYIPKSKLTEDTIQTLLEAGISYDKITELALQQPNSVDPQTKMLIKQMQEEIKNLKAETEGTKKTITQSQEENYKQAVNQIRRDVSDLVKEGTEFEAIRETGSVSDVVELIEKTFKEDGVLLTNEEAARQVEEELVERISKYAKLSKIQQKTPTQSKASPEKSVAPQGEKQPQPPKTLTNGLTNTRQLSSRERAILAFEGKLNK